MLDGIHQQSEWAWKQSAPHRAKFKATKKPVKGKERKMLMELKMRLDRELRILDKIIAEGEKVLREGEEWKDQ